MTRISTQTFGLGKEFSADFLGTIHTLHDMGFHGIEPFVIFSDQQKNMSKNLWALDTLRTAKQKMDELGMIIPSAHIGVSFGWFHMPVHVIKKNILMLHETYGIRDFVLSGTFGTLAQTKHWAKLTRRISDAIHPYGCRVLYHNHDDEFKKISYHGKTVTAMDVFLELAGSDVMFQLDIGWAGMADDENAIVKKYADRIVSIHLKDFYSQFKNDQYSRKNLPAAAFAPIGDGVISTHKILSMRDALSNFGGNVIIDQDQTSRDMQEDLATGCRNVCAML